MGSDPFPEVLDVEKVGSYPALARAGGGFVWDEVLEYRVWCCPRRGAEDLEEGHDYYYAFSDYCEAAEFASNCTGASCPLALVLQREYINEPEPGLYVHVQAERITEWPVEFLSRPRRTADTIPDFMQAAPDSNRIDVLRGVSS